MNYGSVCSGIEAATVAWHHMGWKPSFFSEIDNFPRAVLAHHYPDVPLHGDFTTIQDGDYEPINLLVGGTPCQSFSVAGLRKGLDDPRGNLMLGFGALAKRLRPTWLVWENVPGVLSANKGRDFGTFLGMLAELGYGFAYRVLDARYAGLPHSRKRVFVVGYRGDWRCPANVLFKQDGCPRNIKEGGAGRKSFAPETRSRIANDSGVFGCLVKGASKYHNLSNQEAFSGAYHLIDGGRLRNPTLREGCLLQGFPENYLDPWHRSYWRCMGALGNSMAVPVMRHIGERIEQVEEILKDQKEIA